MPINCICPQCRKTLSISEEFAGQPMRCPLCTALFQSPSRTVLAGAVQQAPAPTMAANSAPVAAGDAPWHTPGRTDPAAPEWPWLKADKVATVPGPAYDWRAVKPLSAEAVRLAPGWHMVRRGLTLMPGSIILVFASLALSQLFYLVARPEPSTHKIVLLIVIPVMILGALSTLIGKGLCCLAPPEAGVRGLALCAAGAVFVALMAGMLGMFLSIMLSDPAQAATRPGFSFLNVVKTISYGAFCVLLVSGGVLFLLFMRSVALVFENKRLAQHLLWYLIFFGLSPALGLLLSLLLGGTAFVLGLHDQEELSALKVVTTSMEFALAGAVLAGFLLMLRDVRSTIERVILPGKA